MLKKPLWVLSLMAFSVGATAQSTNLQTLMKMGEAAPAQIEEFKMPIASENVDAQDIQLGDEDKPSASREPLNLNQLLNKSTSKSAMFNIDGVRYMAIKEAGVSYGMQAGLAYQAKINRDALQNRAQELDQIYNFQGLMINSNIVPPILMQANSVYDQQTEDTLRLGNSFFKILSQAHFASNPPSWRNYLLRAYDADYSMPMDVPLKSSDERAAWKQSVAEGFNLGAKQANLILRDSWATLQRDYLGMVLYHKLLRNGMVTQPYVTNLQTDVVGDTGQMTVGDTVLRISAMPELIPDRSSWKGTPQKSPRGYVTPQPGRIKDDDPARNYQPIQ